MYNYLFFFIHRKENVHMKSFLLLLLIINRPMIGRSLTAVNTVFEGNFINADLRDIDPQKLQSKSSTNKSQANPNILRYAIGEQKFLSNNGIIIVPAFAKSKIGPNCGNELFDNELDLPNQTEIKILAQEVGMKAIGNIFIVGNDRYSRDEDYVVHISVDKQSATIKIQNSARFKTEKVIFVVSENQR